MYKIMWNGGYGVEEIDTAEDADEAEYLVNEYRLAYGGSVWSKGDTNGRS